MIEEDEGDLITDDDGGYDQFNLGVARINHAFQQVKFWEFTQPCLYLARALPYISTGRTVEGYLVSWCFCGPHAALYHSHLDIPRYFDMAFMKCILFKRFPSLKLITGLISGSMLSHLAIESTGPRGHALTWTHFQFHHMYIAILILLIAIHVPRRLIFVLNHLREQALLLYIVVCLLLIIFNDCSK